GRRGLLRGNLAAERLAGRPRGGRSGGDAHGGRQLAAPALLVLPPCRRRAEPGGPDGAWHGADGGGGRLRAGPKGFASQGMELGLSPEPASRGRLRAGPRPGQFPAVLQSARRLVESRVPPMTTNQDVFIGSDSGATTSKTGGVWADGSMVSMKLLQSATNAQLGTSAVIKGWVEGVAGFLAQNRLSWRQVRGVGLAIPGPYLRYGVLGRAANLPASFDGWNFHEDYSRALAQAAGRSIPPSVGNDGRFGGVAEAKLVRAGKKASVLLLAPGSGLGCAFIDANGLPLDGETLSGMEAAHMPAPLHMLGMKEPFPCGCGRTWGC